MSAASHRTFANLCVTPSSLTTGRVVVISFAVLGVATLLNTRERGTHVTLLAVLAIVTALNLALIVALEHPFSGSIAVSDQPLRVGVPASPIR